MKWKIIQTVTPEWKQEANLPEHKIKILFFHRTCDQGMQMWLNVSISTWNSEFCFFLSKHKVQGKNKIPELLSLSLRATTMSPNLINLKMCVSFKYILSKYCPEIQWNLDLSFPQRSFSRMYCSQFLVPNQVPYK